MKLFEDIIIELRSWMGGMREHAPEYAEHNAGADDWPAGERGNIVMQVDTGVELGNPRDESASFLLWTSDLSLVKDGRITRIGPDVSACRGRSVPFGKAAILAVTGFTKDNCFERHREMELVRSGLNLKGYMMRATSQHMREWSRISTGAVENGFSLAILGSSLINRYRSLPYVAAAEMLFVTSAPEHVRALQRIGIRSGRLIAAMSKMVQELSFDCDTCDYNDICSEVDVLKSMRRSMKKEAFRG
ncbi:MAG: hypothetical protein JXA07_09965 [Spirochaetes bacterium]|nr:hypothetical protein [Spirochaetota bacterium]